MQTFIFALLTFLLSFGQVASELLTVHVAQNEQDFDRVLNDRQNNYHTAIFVARGNAAVKATFEEAAGLMIPSLRNRGKYLYAEAQDSAFSISIHHILAEEVVAYSGDFGSAKQIGEFFNSNVIPLFGELFLDSSYIRAAYELSATDGMLWVCFPTESLVADVNQYGDIFREAAKKWPRIPFTFLRTTEIAAYKESGCSIDDHSSEHKVDKTTLVYQRGTSPFKDVTHDVYIKHLASRGEISVEFITNWLSDIQHGNTKPAKYVKRAIEAGTKLQGTEQIEHRTEL